MMNFKYDFLLEKQKNLIKTNELEQYVLVLKTAIDCKYATLMTKLVQSFNLAHNLKVDFQQLNDLYERKPEVSCKDDFISQGMRIFRELENLMSDWCSCQSPVMPLINHDNWKVLPDACKADLQWKAIMEPQIKGFYKQTSEERYKAMKKLEKKSKTKSLKREAK
jgi:hypothetical protein